jgi:hypothetical protein
MIDIHLLPSIAGPCVSIWILTRSMSAIDNYFYTSRIVCQASRCCSDLNVIQTCNLDRQELDSQNLMDFLQRNPDAIKKTKVKLMKRSALFRSDIVDMSMKIKNMIGMLKYESI